jgi:hypothetical protein
MPFSTPHGVAIVLYSPVCIGCSTASRSVYGASDPARNIQIGRARSASIK